MTFLCRFVSYFGSFRCVYQFCGVAPAKLKIFDILPLAN